MEIFEMPVQIRWADPDPNSHFRHSVYYDWAAMCRIDFLNKMGLTPSLMQSLNFLQHIKKGFPGIRENLFKQ